MSPRSYIGCVQNDFRGYGTFGANRAPILHRHWIPTDQNEIPHDPLHLGVKLGASEMISKPMVCLAQTVHQTCTDTNTISKWTETRFHMTHAPRSSIGCIQKDFRAYGTFDANRATILHRHWLPTDRNEIPHDPHHLGVPSGASKMISEPMVCSAPTVQLSCTNTGSQLTKTRFHLTHVT